ncbi:hypothetical protein FRB91_006006 [Serendipita sp. 411]|nr:hypothetical protein FRC15_002642 [Serendipita sp. 397]KAG8839083.1 hypothetical protein FRC18_000962 [Serendipita sp. 400]KAG8859883.1 hypothetical protein FRB91_006006 [Serendipita sp. 411]KAG8872714.1 hypothetical protein FRC20_009126 [Serendipita sp. 405]
MNVPRVPGTAPRKSHLTLSNKQYTKITGTIASVRKSRHPGGYSLEEEEEPQVNGTRRSSHATVDITKEPSFIAEQSFIRAPLNSRVASRIVPAKKGKAKAEPLDNVPLDIQEAMILEDLLFALMGIEGTHIVYNLDEFPEDDDGLLKGIQFSVSVQLDPSLRDLVERIIPLATYYTSISTFVELRSHLDYGLVNHALCAAIRDMLKDYQTLLSQLEHAFNSSPSFTLQKFWFYIHPTLHTMSLIYSLVCELSQTDTSSDESNSGSSDDDDELNEELGLASGLKAVKLNEMGIGGGGIVKGGEVVAILWDRMQNMSGDPTAFKLYGKLFKAAGRPFASTVEQWIRTGLLKDPYEEVMVKESKFINRGTLEMDYTDEYWERRYTLRDGSSLSAPSKRHQAGVPPPRTAGGRLPGGACIPPFMESWKHKILLAGKYLNVIRECGLEIKGDTQGADEADWDMSSDKFYKSIEDGYTYANRTLLKLLMEDQQLVPRLRSLKYYFFLSQSSFLTHFLDLSASELRKPVKGVSIVKLQSLLDLALNSGEVLGYKDDVKVTMATSGLYEWLLKVVSVSGAIAGEGEELGVGHSVGAVSTGEAVTDDPSTKEKDKGKKDLQGIDALTLDYNVRFPLSLVISRKTILRYQLIFRFLLHLKHVEQMLTSMWVDHKAPNWRVPTTEHTEFTQWRSRVFVLRARMLAFVQQILAFATVEVLEPNWRKLEAKLGKVTTVDQLLRDHVDFLDTCLKECMLTSSKLLRVYSRMLVTCSTFALYSAHFTKSVNQGVAALAQSDKEASSVPMQKRWEFLGRFETNFTHFSKVHHDCVQFYASSENVALLSLVVRLENVRTTAQTIPP